MALNNVVDNRVKFSLFGFINRVIFINTGDGFVGGYFYNIKSINFLKFGFFGHGSTRHTRKLVIKAEEILEGDGSKSFRLSFYLNALFCLNSLMQAFVIASAVHKTTGKFVNNYNLAVFNNIINITLHNTVSANSLIYMVSNLNIFAVVKIFNLEILFGLFYTVGGKNGGICLFVNNIVAVISGILVTCLVIHFFNLNHLKRLCK